MLKHKMVVAVATALLTHVVVRVTIEASKHVTETSHQLSADDRRSLSIHERFASTSNAE